VEDTASKLVLIGASAGGPAALVEVLSALPKDFSPAIIIVQHIDQLFAPGLVEWLNGYSHLRVRLACEGDSVSSGDVLVAASDDHLVFKNSRELGYTADPKENPYRPSVDVFFESAARFFRGAMTGVLLTGMGRDGARGLKVLRDAGYHTIAQDKSTSAVFGMPKAAAALNAASEILPLQKIGPRLRELFGSEAKTTLSQRRQRIGDRATGTNKPRQISRESDQRG
jgi:two-component system, chemotaxis family, response regulator WspF